MKKYYKTTLEQSANQAPEPQEAGGYRFAEQVTGICRNTLYSLVHRKLIPHIRLSSRLVIFRLDALEKWMNDHAVAETH